MGDMLSKRIALSKTKRFELRGIKLYIQSTHSENGVNERGHVLHNQTI